MADNPWPGGIAETTWWFSEQCLLIGGVSGGIYADKPGFHNTVDANQAEYPNNYSIALPILVEGPQDKARAFDWVFPEAKTHNYFRINKYSALLMAASLDHDPRLRGLYEWFGTDNGTNIGYNVYKDKPSSSDDSHDWHIHFSFITAYLLDWCVVQGVISVLREESLAAYRARGGQIIGEWPPGTDIEMTMFVQIASDPDPKPVYKSDGWHWEHLTSAPAWAGVQAAGIPLIVVPDQAAFKALCGKPYAEVPPAQIVLTDEQLVALASAVTAGILGPMADAQRASAEVLDQAAREEA
jgi:hypothetical protein